MTFGNFRAGLDILANYVKEDEYCLNADHDRFWAGPDDGKVSAEDKKRLKKLGWFQDKEADGRWSAHT